MDRRTSRRLQQHGSSRSQLHGSPPSLSNDDRTKGYVAKRTAEGKTIGEIARILKRYVAREVDPHLPSTIG